jgi:hypothetical protein
LRVFNLAKNTLEWRGFVGISRDYPLKTWTIKQPIGEIQEYKIISSIPPNKLGLKDHKILVNGAWRHVSRVSCLLVE